jgi:hypothetical protein
MTLKPKSVLRHDGLMFTRTTFDTPDMGEQDRLSGEVALLVDAGTLRTTPGQRGDRIDAADLRRAHRTLETGTARGKIVPEGAGA